MRDAAILASMALCLFCLWVTARNDLKRLFGISRTVRAVVIGHRRMPDDQPSYSAVLRFSAEGAEHEVVDQLCHATPQPPIGTELDLTYPVGRPDLARVPRPLAWSFVYAVLIGTTVLLGGLLFGYIDPKG